MTKPGRRPTPTAIKRARGNPGKRKLNEREPNPPLGAPRCPAWFDKDAKGAWKRLAVILDDLGVLATTDAWEMEVLCDTYSRWRKACIYLQEHDNVLTRYDEDGNVSFVQSVPQVIIAKNLAALLRGMLSDFGLSPSARSSLISTKPAAKDDVSAFVAGKPEGPKLKFPKLAKEA